MRGWSRVRCKRSERVNKFNERETADADSIGGGFERLLTAIPSVMEPQAGVVRCMRRGRGISSSAGRFLRRADAELDVLPLPRIVAFCLSLMKNTIIIQRSVTIPATGRLFSNIEKLHGVSEILSGVSSVYPSIFHFSDG